MNVGEPATRTYDTYLAELAHVKPVLWQSSALPGSASLDRAVKCWSWHRCSAAFARLTILRRTQTKNGALVRSGDVVPDRKLRGSAGEHLVCGVLAQFNWAAALRREGVARTDVLAVNADTGRTV
jgi:hypothetical protein